MPAVVSLPCPSPPINLAVCREHLKAHYRRLGEASRRLRFMGQTSVATADRIADGASPDLFLEVEEDGDVRGVLEAYATSPGHAEVALSVEDAYQGHGLGRTLFEEGLRQLAARGFQSADLACLRQNKPILHLVKSHGGHVHMDSGDVWSEIELAPEPTAAMHPAF